MVEKWTWFHHLSLTWTNPFLKKMQILRFSIYLTGSALYLNILSRNLVNLEHILSTFSLIHLCVCTLQSSTKAMMEELIYEDLVMQLIAA